MEDSEDNKAEDAKEAEGDASDMAVDVEQNGKEVHGVVEDEEEAADDDTKEDVAEERDEQEGGKAAAEEAEADVAASSSPAKAADGGGRTRTSSRARTPARPPSPPATPPKARNRSKASSSSGSASRARRGLGEDSQTFKAVSLTTQGKGKFFEVVMPESLTKEILLERSAILDQSTVAPFPRSPSLYECAKEFQRTIRSDDKAGRGVLDMLIVSFNALADQMLLYEAERAKIAEAMAETGGSYASVCGPEHLLRLVLVLPTVIVPPPAEKTGSNRIVPTNPNYLPKLGSILERLMKHLQKNQSTFFSVED